MSSGLSTLGRSASKRVCSFRWIILPARTSGPRTKSASIFSRLKFTAGIHGATVTSAYQRGVYSFNLFNGRWMLMQMVGVEKRREEELRERESWIPRSSWTPNVNEFPQIPAYIPKDFHHPPVCYAIPHLSLTSGTLSSRFLLPIKNYEV